MLTDEQISNLRSHFPILQEKTYLYNCSAVSARRDGVRFAFHVYNTLDDVQTALVAIEDNRELMVRT